jgi:hypothetical protein
MIGAEEMEDVLMVMHRVKDLWRPCILKIAALMSIEQCSSREYALAS